MRYSNPNFIKTIERKILYHTQLEFLFDVFQVVEVAKQSEAFSHEFYSGLFEKAI